MTRNTLSLLCLALAAGLAGCVSPTPKFDESFGDAVRTARTAQTLNPEAGGAGTVAGLDGTAAKESIIRYQDSFKAPPTAVNVLNIGGGLGGGGQ